VPMNADPRFFPEPHQRGRMGVVFGIVFSVGLGVVRRFSVAEVGSNLSRNGDDGKSWELIPMLVKRATRSMRFAQAALAQEKSFPPNGGRVCWSKEVNSSDVFPSSVLIPFPIRFPIKAGPLGLQ